MKKIVLTTMAAGAALAASIPALAEDTDSSAILNVLSTYETALNTQDTDTIVSLYTEDGVFMPQHSQPQVGRDNIRAAYVRVFEAITLDVDFEVDEVRQLSGDWAFVRTRSEGTVKINATGDSAPEGNQELFLFQRTEGGSWKIARYVFSTTNPPRG